MCGQRHRCGLAHAQGFLLGGDCQKVHRCRGDDRNRHRGILAVIRSPDNGLAFRHRGDRARGRHRRYGRIPRGPRRGDLFL